MSRTSNKARKTSRAGLATARRICTSEDCPMAAMLEAMPHLCDLEPPRSEQKEPDQATRNLLARYEAVKPYSDKVWGPASWTALEADILSLPEKLDAHEFCLFKIYLALRARYLSCSACAIHFEKALKAMPNDATHRTRAGLLRWLCGVHNDVNRRKQRAALSEEEILAILNGKAAHEDGEAHGEGEAGEAGEEDDGAGESRQVAAAQANQESQPSSRSAAAGRKTAQASPAGRKTAQSSPATQDLRMSPGLWVAALLALIAIALLAASASGALKWSWWRAKRTSSPKPKRA